MARSAERLGTIHRDIRIAQEVFWLLIPRRTQGDADAGSGAHVVPVQPERLRQARVETLGKVDRVADVRDLLEQDRKLIATQTRHGIARAQTRLQAARDGNQLLIPDGMTEAVIAQ